MYCQFFMRDDEFPACRNMFSPQFFDTYPYYLVAPGNQTGAYA
jgi:hypothetical protein